MSVNYLIEIIGLDDWELTHPIPATAYKLLRKLQYLANKERFPERISVSNGLLMSMIGCSEDSLIKARNWLIQQGLITYKGQKKLTPVYALRYFSNNPVYNSKFQGLEQGIKQGNGQGIKQGLGPGIKHGTYLNERVSETSTGSDEDTAWRETEATPEDSIPGLTHLHHRTLPDRRLRVYLEGRNLNVEDREIERVLPARTRPLTDGERRTREAVMAFLDGAEQRELFGERQKVILRILASDRFPLELVGEAAYQTSRRNDKYRLDNPVAYMLTLLFDWEERGIRTVAELRDSKDDWWDRGYTEAK